MAYHVWQPKRYHGSAVSLDPADGLNKWKIRGGTIPMPKNINAGYRDSVVRAFEYEGAWYVGVGCGNDAKVDPDHWGAQ